MNEIQVLWMAVEQGDDTAFQRLMREGAELEAVDDGGRTALLWAVDKGEDDLVRQLLAAGANPNAENHDREQPLDIAAHIGLADTAKMLLAAGAQIRPEMLEDPYWHKIEKYWNDDEQTQLAADVRRVIRAHQLSRDLLGAMGNESPSARAGGTPSL